MSDLIHKEDVIKIIDEEIKAKSDYLQHNAQIDIMYKVQELPTVEAKAVVHGKWLPIGMRAVGLYSPTHYCSECKGHGFDYYDFCNNCGCDMRGWKK